MPLYSFRNKDTNEVIEDFMTISERDQFLSRNPEYVQELAAPPIGDSVRLGVKRIDNGFNDVLKKAKNAHLHSTIQTRN